MQPHNDSDFPTAADATPADRLPYLDESAALPIVGPWLAACGIEPDDYPTGDLGALRVAQGLGYRVGPEYVSAWAVDPHFAELAPPVVDGRREWRAHHLFALVGRCEADRRFDPLDERHAAKCSVVARLAAEAEREGWPPSAAVHDMDQYTQRDIVFLLARTGNPQVRLSLADLLLLKLEKAGVDTDVR